MALDECTVVLSDWLRPSPSVFKKWLECKQRPVGGCIHIVLDNWHGLCTWSPACRGADCETAVSAAVCCPQRMNAWHFMFWCAGCDFLCALCALCALGSIFTAIDELELRGIVQLATFHPEYQFAHKEPGDAENWTNRSPFPMLHLLVGILLPAVPSCSTYQSEVREVSYQFSIFSAFTGPSFDCQQSFPNGSETTLVTQQPVDFLLQNCACINLVRPILHLTVGGTCSQREKEVSAALENYGNPDKVWQRNEKLMHRKGAAAMQEILNLCTSRRDQNS